MNYWRLTLAPEGNSAQVPEEKLHDLSVRSLLEVSSKSDQKSQSD
jgi:hypothetical protein